VRISVHDANLADERFFAVVQEIVHLDDVLADLDAFRPATTSGA
jgi:hypothetical protein